MWIRESPARNHKFFKHRQAWVINANLQIENGGKKQKQRLKDLAETMERQRLEHIQSSSDRVSRNWEWAVPTLKWSLAFPGRVMPQGDEHYGSMTVEGAANTKVVFVLRDAAPRPWCYEVNRTCVRSLQHTTLMHEVDSEDDEDLEAALVNKKGQSFWSYSRRLESQAVLRPFAASELGAGCCLQKRRR